MIYCTVLNSILFSSVLQVQRAGPVFAEKIRLMLTVGGSRNTCTASRQQQEDQQGQQEEQGKEEKEQQEDEQEQGQEKGEVIGLGTGAGD